ncbi:S41 family peptidase [Thermoanaerobacter sp. CM-CNRG TB177]|uniref:S41 family peptidase n=3 Tax=Thermoanaerobacter sp. CM-CNRG TB177 TaxID=2800659 RepID=UPI00316EAF6C
MSRRLPILMLTLVFLAIIFFGTHIFLNTQLNLYQPWGLTERQKIEDFEYMYDILKDNYAHFYEVKKMYGYDWLEHKKKFKEKIKKTKNNLEFYYALNDILLKLHDGHTRVLDPGTYKYLLESVNLKPYEDILRKSESSYKMWEKIFKNAHEESKLEDYFSRTRKKENVVTEIVVPGKVAYLKIYSFLIDYHKEGEEYKKEREMIYDFLKSIKNYQYLFIDISDNKGGNGQYWLEAIIGPLRDKLKGVENLSIEEIFLVRGGDYVVKILENFVPDLKNNTIDKLPMYNLLPMEVKKSFRYYLTMKHTIKDFEKYLKDIDPVGFNGKIFLVISRATCSAANDFAKFCKETGFATLIGERTTGDGGWFMPDIMCLPNSGLIVRFDGAMIINQDGTSYFETGTIPDIEIKMIPKDPFEKDEELKQKILEVIKSLESEEKGIK